MALIGKKGKKLLELYIDKISKNSQDPWATLSYDFAFIESVFGTEAAEWGLQHKKQQLRSFMRMFKQREDVKAVLIEEKISDNDIMNL